MAQFKQGQTPVYSKFYVECTEDEDGAFPVHQETEIGDLNGHLRRGTLQDLVNGKTPFVEIDHEIAYPYGAWDWEDSRTPLFATLAKQDSEPARYCQAALVFTPSAALIG